VLSAPPRPGHDARPYRIKWVRQEPPIGFRSTPDGVYIVGTAASPVGRDHVRIRVVIESGARVAVRSAASMIAWSSEDAVYEIEVTVEQGACLDWKLQPLVVSAACRFRQRVFLDLADGAQLHWSEEVVLGRSGEEPGDVRLGLDADLGSGPLLRHELAAGPSHAGWDGPAVLGCNRAARLVLTVDRPSALPEATAGPGWAVMPLPGGRDCRSAGALTQALAPDLLALQCLSAMSSPACAPSSTHPTIQPT
jgi:urease accessory protein